MADKYTVRRFEELVKEASYLKTVLRPGVAKRLAEARSFGDLSENSEYDEARTDQAKTEARIKELEKKIANAIIIDESKVDPKKVSLESIVTITYQDGESEELAVVSANEVNALNGKISSTSPLGEALMGHRVGDKIEVKAKTSLFCIITDIRR